MEQAAKHKCSHGGVILVKHGRVNADCNHTQRSTMSVIDIVGSMIKNTNTHTAMLFYSVWAEVISSTFFSSFFYFSIVDFALSVKSTHVQ